MNELLEVPDEAFGVPGVLERGVSSCTQILNRLSLALPFFYNKFGSRFFPFQISDKILIKSIGSKPMSKFLLSNR